MSLRVTRVRFRSKNHAHTRAIDLAVGSTDLYNNWIGYTILSTTCTLTPLAAMLNQQKKLKNFVNDNFKYVKHLLEDCSCQKYEVWVRRVQYVLSAALSATKRTNGSSISQNSNLEPILIVMFTKVCIPQGVLTIAIQLG